MTYSIGQVSEMLSISISTLRYYDKKGILPLLDRTKGNIRMFNEIDIECLKIIECLKNTGMELKDIRHFFELCEKGDSTLRERYELFEMQKEKTERQMKTLQDSLNLINYKCEYYRIAQEKGTTDIPGLKDKLIEKFSKKTIS